MKHSAILVLACIFLSACKPQYTLTKDSVLARFQNPSVKIIKYEGAEGPFKEDMGFAGSKDLALSFSWNTPNGETKVEAPAAPGYFYQIQRYQNKSKEYFYIVLKVPNQS